MKTKQTKLPWKGRPSLYKYVKTHVNKEGYVPFENWVLPDIQEEIYFKLNYRDYTPGETDWIEEVNADDVNPEFVTWLVDIIERYSKTGKEEDKLLLYNVAKENRLIAYLQPLGDAMSTREISIEPYTLKLGQWMALEAPDRGAVKFGMFLVGVSSDDLEDISMLCLLGMHEEFTYFTGDALRNMTPMWDLLLLDMAKKLSSWGRLQAVTLLAQESTRKEVKHWVIREGFRRFFTPCYITLTCAEYAGLVDELAREHWDGDKRLLGAAQVMILDMLKACTEKFSNTFGGEVVSRYLATTLGKRKSVIHYCVLVDLLTFLEKAMNDVEMRDAIGMTEEDCSNMWIDVKRELQKKWSTTLVEKLNLKEIDPCNRDYCNIHTKAYDQICNH